MLRELVDACFDGSTEALLMTLIKSENLSEQELLGLKRLAEAKPNCPTAKRSSKP
jgi:hypothetical protein